MKEFFRKYKSVIIGAGIGLVLAVLMLTIGFFKTLLIILLGGVGALIGGVPVIRDRIKDLFEKLFASRK